MNMALQGFGDILSSVGPDKWNVICGSLQTEPSYMGNVCILRAR